MTKRCTRCDEVKETGDFYVRRQRGSVYVGSRCKACERDRASEWHRKTMASQDGAERRRKSSRESTARCWRRMKTDPDRMARFLESQRMARRLRAEREGRTITRTPMVCMPKQTQMRLPAEPFHAWVRERLGPLGGLTVLAERCGVSERSLLRVMGQDRVSLDFADRALTNEGSTLLFELWPEMGE